VTQEIRRLLRSIHGSVGGIHSRIGLALTLQLGSSMNWRAGNCLILGTGRMASRCSVTTALSTCPVRHWGFNSMRDVCVVFDLDDTLYLERDYIVSGFK